MKDVANLLGMEASILAETEMGIPRTVIAVLVTGEVVSVQIYDEQVAQAEERKMSAEIQQKG